MDKIKFLLLLFSQLFLFKSSYAVNVINSYNFGSGSYALYFDNLNYDYYVFDNYISTNKRIYFTFCYELSSLYVYTYTSTLLMDKYAIVNNLDSFSYQNLQTDYNSKSNNYCFSFDYKKTGNNLYYYIAIHLPDSATYKTYFMQIDSYINLNGQAFLNTTYKFDSGKDSFYFERSQYEYYILGGYLNSKDRIYFKFYYTLSDLDAFTYATEYSMDANDIQSYLQYFVKQPMEIDYYYNQNDYRFSFDYKKIGKYDYYYIALHLPSYASTSSRYLIKIDSYTISAGEIAIVIIIIIAVLVGLALISMGIAKMLGRSPLDGLLCFFILCAICCCRRR